MNSRFYEYLRKEFVKIFESEDWKELCRERSKNRFWINDGKNSKMVKDFELDIFLKKGWSVGRIMNKSNLGKHIYTEEEKKMKMKNKKSKKKKKIDMNNIFNNKKITKANNI